MANQEIAQPVSVNPNPTLRSPAAPRVRIPDWLHVIFKNRKATVGISILLVFIGMAVFAPQVSGTTQPQRFVARSHLPPGSVQNDKVYIMGTTRQGQDLFAQLVWGARTTLSVGFAAGTLIILNAILIGVTAGYIGGWVDEALSLFMNIFLILPGLPLIIVLSSFLQQSGPSTIILVLGFVNWAYAARVLRSQTLALRNSEFVAAAKVSGEPTWRIILFEILPNMTSLVASAWIGSVLFAVLSEASLRFIGIGDANSISWGGILYWAQQNQALLVGAWWTFIPPGICIALVGLSLTLINYAIDEITNPRLQSGN
jgi:peptide/nickel transport system permease protein